MVVAVWMVSVASPGGGLEGASELSLRLKDAPWRTKPGRYPPWIRQALLGLPVLIGLSFIVFAFGHRPTRDPTAVGRVQWSVPRHLADPRTRDNRSAEAVEPHFATDASGYMTTFWNVVSGPKKLAPDSGRPTTLSHPMSGQCPV